MKEYTIDICDTKEHVYFSYVVLDYNLYSALENAVEKAYHDMDKTGKVLRYVDAKDSISKKCIRYNLMSKEKEVF